MPCTNVPKQKELTSRKQIAGQKSEEVTYSSSQFYIISTADSTRNTPNWSVAGKKSLVNSHVRWPTAWRGARKFSQHKTYQIVWAFAMLDYQRHELGTATCTFADSSLVFVRTWKIGEWHFVWTWALWAMKFSARTAELILPCGMIFVRDLIFLNLADFPSIYKNLIPQKQTPAKEIIREYLLHVFRLLKFSWND